MGAHQGKEETDEQGTHDARGLGSGFELEIEFEFFEPRESEETREMKAKKDHKHPTDLLPNV